MRIWVDLDNTPHVPLFRPIIRSLEAEGHAVLVTARDAYQVPELARRLNVACSLVGRHSGRNRILKLVGTFQRAAQLFGATRRFRPDLAVSHGSRSQFVASAVGRIRTLEMSDYEHTSMLPLMCGEWYLLPEVLESPGRSIDPDRIRHYPGIKEDIYVPDFVPDERVYKELNLRSGAKFVTVRPPATEAHYHVPESDRLFSSVMETLLACEELAIVLLPRSDRQRNELGETYRQPLAARRIRIPERPLDGLNLIWHSQFVVSGGGTMNREAAALRVPVYSIFRGKIGAVDRYLSEAGRLILLKNARDLGAAIDGSATGDRRIEEESAALRSVVEHICQIARNPAV